MRSGDFASARPADRFIVGSLETPTKTVHLWAGPGLYHVIGWEGHEGYIQGNDQPYGVNFENLKSVLSWWDTGVGPNGETLETAKIENLYDYLKQHATKIHFFGLGFIQVKLRKNERYHFYSPELAAITPPEEVHDHRYGFTSTVIKGVLEQELYAVEADPEAIWGWQMRQVSCDPEKPTPTTSEPVRLIRILKSEQVERSSYQIEHGAFHKVLPAKVNTITYLIRGPKIKEFARVVSKGKEEVCPFSKQMSEDECWVHVKKIIV